MANDKMTYNEFFGVLQTSAQGRQYIGKEIEANLERKYMMSGARGQGLTMEQFVSLREKQMRDLFNVFVELNSGSCNRLMRPRDLNDTSEEGIRRVTGPNGLYNTGFIAADYDDRSMVSELVSKSKGLDGNPYRHYVSAYEARRIIDNMQAIKTLTEREFGVTLDNRQLCSSTEAMVREIHLAKSTYEMPGFENWTRYQRPGKFSKALKALGDLINGVKEQDKPLGDKEIGS